MEVDRTLPAVTLGDLLSPAPSQSRVARVTGRFGYQMVADIISFANNLPQRLLLLDQLERLPEVVHKMLRDDDVVRLLRDEVLRARRVADIQDSERRTGEARLLLGQLAAVEGASVEQCRRWCDSSAKHLCRMADVAWKIASQDTLAAGTAVLVDDLKRDVAAASYPPHWFTVLETLLPHIERDIWLTDLSAPLPAHAIARMHDPWAALIMLWSYEYRGLFVEPVEPEQITAEGIQSAFCTNVLKFAVAEGWSVDAHSQASGMSGSDPSQAHRIRVVVGPFLTRQDGNAEAAKPHLKLVRQFREYMQLAAHVIPGWERSADSMPAMGELMDAYDSRFPVAGDEELRLRFKSMGRAWEIARGIVVGPMTIPTRDEWETCAALAAWVARWQHLLLASLPEDRPRSVSLPRWHERVMQLSLTGQGAIRMCVRDLPLPGDVQEHWLEQLKRDYFDLDLPLVLWNRLRERQNASWSARIVAISNLMQRLSSDPERFTAETTKPLAPHLLLGFGSRLCRHVANISQAHDVVVYWLDYSEEPPRLKMVSSYSRSITNRVRREQMQLDFDSSTYDPADPLSACHLRGQSPSMLYRTVARNRSNIWHALDPSPDHRIMFNGYEHATTPRSAMTLPLRAHGRVIGALELIGLADRQFSRQLRVPLRRVATLVGPVMYQNLLLWQLGRINSWAVNHRPFELEDHRINRLQRLAKLLCNVFACPVVQIWLRSSNRLIFDLEGRSRPMEPEDSTAHSKPYFSIDDAPFSTLSSTDPFALLALAAWNDPCPPLVRGRQEPRPPAWGQLAKGIYRETESTTSGNLEEALSQGVVLGADFLRDASPSRRWAMAQQHLREIAAFALVRSGSTRERGESDPEVIGAVTLHGYGDEEPDGYKDRSGVAPPLGQASTSSNYGSAWAPLVAYMQEHLPNVLQQVKLLVDPAQQIVSLVNHEARHELMESAKTLQNLRQQLHYALHGGGRRALQVARERAVRTPEGAWLVRASDFDELAKLDAALRGAAVSHDLIDLEAVEKSFMQLHGRLATARYMNDIGLRTVERPMEMSLRRLLEKSLAGVAVSNKVQARTVRWSTWKAMAVPAGAQHPERLQGQGRLGPWADVDAPYVRVDVGVWNLVLGNLFDNMDKYSPQGSFWQFELHPRDRKLVLINEGPYDPARDDAERFMLPGVRGTQSHAKPGEGLGLAIAQRAARALAIDLRYSIQASATPSNTARHMMTLDLINIWRAAPATPGEESR